ncbi:hypothetical protein [Oleomonas cavernae]|nr:hypothetical protein [Oleomonas cavernae]
MSMTTIKQEIAELRARLNELEERVDAGMIEGDLGPEATEADLDAWLARNWPALEQRSLEGYAALARGECLTGTADETAAVIMEDLRRRAAHS